MGTTDDELDRRRALLLAGRPAARLAAMMPARAPSVPEMEPAGLWRLGNRNSRNLYYGDMHIGMLIEPSHARMIVTAMNAARAREDWDACCDTRALQLDRLIEERNAGMADATAGILRLLRTEYEATQNLVMLRAVELVLRYGENGSRAAVEAPSGPAGRSGHPRGSDDLSGPDSNPPE